MPPAHREGARRKSSRSDKIRRKSSANSKSVKREQQISLQLVESEDCALIHDAVLKILNEVGVIIDHAQSREILVKQHDCKLGDDGYVRMSPDLVNKAIATVPNKIAEVGEF